MYSCSILIGGSEPFLNKLMKGGATPHLKERTSLSIYSRLFFRLVEPVIEVSLVLDPRALNKYIAMNLVKKQVEIRESEVLLKQPTKRQKLCFLAKVASLAVVGVIEGLGRLLAFIVVSPFIALESGLPRIWHMSTDDRLFKCSMGAVLDIIASFKLRNANCEAIINHYTYAIHQCVIPLEREPLDNLLDEMSYGTDSQSDCSFIGDEEWD